MQNHYHSLLVQAEGTGTGTWIDSVFLLSLECPKFLLHSAVWDKVWNAVDTLGRWISSVFSRPRPACFVQWLKEPERGSEVSRKWNMVFQFFLFLSVRNEWCFLHWCQKTCSNFLVSAWQFCFLDICSHRESVLNLGVLPWNRNFRVKETGMKCLLFCTLGSRTCWFCSSFCTGPSRRCPAYGWLKPHV